MKLFQKTPLALGVAAGMAMLVASTGAQAISTGTDLNLSAHAAAGGMAGAAYTRPQEISAAVAGNPATLTQFPGVNFNFGAALISITDVNTVTDTTLDTVLGPVTGKGDHHSDADNYIVPTLGLSLQVSPNLFLGVGLEADAGLGSDFRDDPLELFGGTFKDVQDLGLGGPDTIPGNLTPLDGPVAAPLLVEVISFNANFAAAYKVTDRLSLGGALTLGFGLAQLGTAGPTTGFDTVSDLVVDGLAAGLGGVANNGTLETGVLSNWGGSTSSVHDIGFGWTLGSTYIVTDGITTSLTVKSPLEYKFKNIIYADPATTGGALVPGNAVDGWQHLDIEQPLEIIAGVAFEDVLVPNLLVELDVIWKNWGDADAYEDAYDDQFLVALGAQYTTGNWQLRAGYSWADEILKDTPNSTLGKLTGLGNLPLGEGAAALDVATGAGVVEPLATDFVEIVQMSLLPVIWEHTFTAGVGYSFTDAVRVDAFVAYALPEKESRNLEIAAAAADIGLTTLGLAGGNGGSTSTITADVDSEIMFGIGINVALP